MFQIPISKWSITLAFSIYNSVQVNRASISIYSNSDAPYQNSNYLNRYSWAHSSVQVEFGSLLWLHDASGQLHRPAMLPERDFLLWKFKNNLDLVQIKILRLSVSYIDYRDDPVRWDWIFFLKKTTFDFSILIFQVQLSFFLLPRPKKRILKSTNNFRVFDRVVKTLWKILKSKFLK